MQNRHIATLVTATALLALTACEGDDTSSSKPTPPAASSPAELPKGVRESIAADAGLPPEPTGAKRNALLAALTAINPGIGTDKDKAISAARDQCSAINNGSKKLDWTASQRFSYRGNKVTETEGKAINEALKKSGFCKV